MTLFDPVGWIGARDPLEIQDRKVAELGRRLSAQERASALAAFAVQAPWIFVGESGAPAFENNWTNYGVPESPLRYYADPFGNVYIAGSIQRTSGAAATVFTLPAVLRPAWPYIGIPL